MKQGQKKSLYPITISQLNRYIDEKQPQEQIGIAGSPEESILSCAYKHFYDGIHILVSSDAVEVNGVSEKMPQWMIDLVRFEDSRFPHGTPITKEMYERERKVIYRS